MCHCWNGPLHEIAVVVVNLRSHLSLLLKDCQQKQDFCMSGDSLIQFDIAGGPLSCLPSLDLKNVLHKYKGHLEARCKTAERSTGTQRLDSQAPTLLGPPPSYCFPQHTPLCKA